MHTRLSFPPMFARGVLLLGFCGLLASCSVLPGSRGRARPEVYLSKDTFLMVSIPNVAASREKWKQTAMGKAWADPATEYWRSLEFDPVLEETLGKWGAGGAIPLLDMVSGQAVLALERPPESPKSAEKPGERTAPRVAVYAAFSFGERAGEARALIEKNWRRLEEGGTPALPSLEKGGPQQGSAPPIAFHTAPRPDGSALCSAWVGDTFFLSTFPDGLREVLNRRTGRASAEGKRAALGRTPVWQKASRELRKNSDAVAFINFARIHDELVYVIQEIVARTDRKEKGGVLISFLKLCDLDAMETISASLEMRGKGFYQRTAVALRKNPGGILLPPPGAPPLRTPGWAMRDVESFSASRVRPLLEIKQSVAGLLETAEFPFWDPAAVGSLVEERTGFKTDQLLAGFGTEMALMSRDAKPIPDVVLLWEIGQPETLRRAADALTKSFGGATQTESYMGYRFRTHRVPRLPFPIYTAEIGNFFMIATQSRWFHAFLDQKYRLVVQEVEVTPEAPMGAESLLPILEEPFEKVPKDMTVVERAFSNPAPGLRELGAYLPIVFPLVNLQLQSRGMPKIPSWVRSALPPLLPFVQEVFPSVTRTSQKDGLVVSESFSAFDPIASPFAAAGFVILVKYWEEKNK